MNALTRRFPEIARYAMSEARSGRLLASFATSVIVGLCILMAEYSASNPNNPSSTLFWLQALVLLVYGTSRTAGSVLNERQERTWDLQRLTPLSSYEITIGKLLGAPIFAYFIAATLMPWALAEFVINPKMDLFLTAQSYLLLGSIAFAVISAGLMVSAYSTGRLGTSNVGPAGALIGFFALQIVGLTQILRSSDHQTMFYGLGVDSITFQVLSFLAFGAWILAAAKWRIGQELLEGSRLWRIPAFMAFLAWYQFGASNRMNAEGLLMLPALFCYFTAVCNSERLDYWKRWLQKDRGQERLDRTPAWIVASGSFTAVAVVLGFLMSALAENGLKHAVTALMYPCFLVRDLCFFQWCRFTKSKKPEAMALIYIALAYFLPTVLLRPLGLREMNVFFMPVAAPQPSLSDALPGLLQALAAAWFLRFTVRRSLCAS